MSGALIKYNGTSLFFVITALVIQTRQERTDLESAVKRTIKRKVNVGKKGKKQPAKELKGRKTDLPVKEYFWRQVVDIPLRLYALVVEKVRVADVWRKQKSHLYNYLARSLVDRIPIEDGVSSLHVEIDKSKGAVEREEFNEYLGTQIQGRVPPKVALHIRHMLSEESRGVQAADMFSWGVFRKYAQSDEVWYALFRNRIAYESLFLPVVSDAEKKEAS
ncbi:MAG TPA: DUF3800 domain-containing protein [Gemmataceae bacterium]